MSGVDEYVARAGITFIIIKSARVPDVFYLTAFNTTGSTVPAGVVLVVCMCSKAVFGSTLHTPEIWRGI